MDPRQTVLKKIRYFLEYVLFLLFYSLIKNRTASGIYRLGKGIGTMLYHLSAQRRHIARINLDIAFGDTKDDQEKRRIAKQSMIQTAVTALQFLWVAQDTRERVHQLMDPESENLELLEQCLARGKGVFFLIAHFGNWEVTGIHLGYRKISKVHTISRKLDNPYLEKFVMDLRSASGNTVFHKDESPRKIMRALKQNSCVGVMMDQNAGDWGLFVDFFGKKASTPRSLAVLSYSTGAAILPLFCQPTQKGKYRAVYGPELVLEKTDDKQQDIIRWTAACEKMLEDKIRENPEAWMWIHRRWKARPPDENGSPIY